MRKGENSNPNIGLTAVSHRDTVSAHRAVPAAHSYVSEGRLRTLGSPLVALLMQAQGGAVPEGSGTSHRQSARRDRARFAKPSSLMLLLLSVVSWGIILYKCGRSARPSDTPRSSSTSSAAATSSRRSRRSAVARRQPARRAVPVRLRGADRAAPPGGAGRGRTAGQSAAGRRTSYSKSLTAVDRALLRASAVEVNKLESRIRFSRRPPASRRSSACSARSGAS